MTIDWNHFTPWTSLAGGILLGLASALFILLNGRVLGISGIVGGLLRPRRGDLGWRVAFTAGLLVAPALWGLVAAPTLGVKSLKELIAMAHARPLMPGFAWSGIGRTAESATDSSARWLRCFRAK